MSDRPSPGASLQDLLGLLEAHNPGLRSLLEAKSEPAFISATEQGIERAIRLVESGAKEYAVLDERGLSTLLTDLLNQAGYYATAERNVNGHVDIVVEHAFGGRWKYLGECKIYRGYQYHVDGCAQLLGYCTGRERRAFSLDFFRDGGIYQKLLDLRARMDRERPLAQTSTSEDHPITGAFVTSHEHAAKSDIELLHLGCSIAK